MPLPNNASEIEKNSCKEECERYRKPNRYVKTMLTCALSDEICQKVMESEIDIETWTALQNLFEDSSKDQVFQICMEFFSYSWSLESDVPMNIVQLKNL